MSTTLEPPFRSSRYTTGAIVLHWTIAVIIVLQIVGGFVMTDLMAQGSEVQFAAYQLHKSFGIAILVLTVARILWRAFNPPPPVPASVSAREGAIAHAVHVVFYGLLILIPLTGWLLITVSPVQIETVLFFLPFLPWPHLPGFSGLTPDARAELTHLTEWVHAVLAYGMGVLVALHVAGAVKHHMEDGAFIRRMALNAPGDGPRNSYGHATTWLATFVFFGVMVAAATVARTPDARELAVEGVSPDQAAILASAAGLDGGDAAPAAADAPAAAASAAGDAPGEAGAEKADPGPAPLWTVDPEESSLAFAVTFSGEEVTGSFGEFDAQIRFDPQNLEGSSLRVTIPTPSATMESDDITRAQLSGPDGFADASHGTATFVAGTIRAEGEGFVAEGELTLRDTTRPLALPFTVEIDGDRAVAAGAVTLDRFDWGVGVENDASGDWLGEEIRIDVRVAADRAGEAPAAAAQEPSEAAEAGPAPQWTILPDASAVGFSFGLQGATVRGAIEAFAADIRFDPQNLSGSSIYVSLDLDTASVAGDDVTPTQLRGPDGLAVKDGRFARFRADTIRATGENAYEAEGTLELRDARVPVKLPFSLFIVDGRAVAEGTATLDRLAFGVGEENDPQGSTITPQVSVDVRITAISDEARPAFGR